MELYGADLDNAVVEIALKETGAAGTRSLYLNEPRPCVFVPDAPEAKTATRAVVDEKSRSLRIFVPVGEGLAPVIAARALVKDPLAVERGFRVEWNMVVAMSSKEDLAAFRFPKDFLAGLANHPDKILFWRRSKAFHTEVERVRQDPLHFFLSLFAHAEQALIDNARNKTGWLAIASWRSVVNYAAEIAAAHYPKFEVPKSYFAAVKSAQKANAEDGYNYRQLINFVVAGASSPNKFLLKNTTHNLSEISRSHWDVYRRELQRREEHAREKFGEQGATGRPVRKSGVPLTPQNVAVRLKDKRKKFPLTLWREIDALVPKERQLFLDQCLLEVARKRDLRNLEAARSLIERGAMLVVGADGFDPLPFWPEVTLLKRHRDYPNFSPQQLLALFRADKKSLSVLRKAGADLNKADETGRTVAHLVAQDRLPDLSDLIGVPGLDMQREDQTGARPLHYALRQDTLSDYQVEKLIKANLVDFSDPQLLPEVRKLERHSARTKLLLGIAKFSANLPEWAIYALEDELLTNKYFLSAHDKSEIERLLMEHRTGAAPQEQPKGKCQKCGRAAHRGFCRL